MDAAVPLVEIDLIRRGTHVLDVPFSLLEDMPEWDYLANLVRRDSSGFEFSPFLCSRDCRGFGSR